MPSFIPPALGWQPDVPDFRDYTLDHGEVQRAVERMGLALEPEELPSRVDLRDEALLPPPGHQGRVNACCAFGVLDLAEYLQRRLHGRSLEGSKLFLHQLSLRLSGLMPGASTAHGPGTTLRSTLKSLTRFGVPPSRFWPYDAEYVTRDPADPFLYGFAREYSAFRYFRLDPPGTSNAHALGKVKRLLAASLPCVCGFSVPNSITASPHIPLPNGRDELRGGQAVLVLGYDDRYPRTKRRPRAKENRGALLVRNCWGTKWGKDGHGWLRYGCVTAGFVSDFWCLVDTEAPVDVP